MGSRSTEDGAEKLYVGLLGPLEVYRHGVRVEPSSPKQRALLIDLVIHRGETLGRDRLIDDLWGERPPSTAPGVLQNYVSQLRRALGPDVLRTVGLGYALATEWVSVDVDEFEAHVARAHAAREARDMVAVRKVTTDALALWRGDPLADVAFQAFGRAETVRLRELRAVALELHLEAEVAGGGHREAVTDLEAEVANHPLHERLWGLLMLALYRSGRQADALRAYQRARATLADELGIDPGRELRDLERAILDQNRDLDDLLVSAPARRRTSAAPARPSMIGRQREWSVIEAFLDGTDERAGRLLLLAGEPGIGKTRLLEEAHAHVQSGGGTVVAGRGFEAERRRPYGAWVDAVRGMPLPDLDAATRVGLAPLLPELSDEPVQLDDPNRLYDAVVRIIKSLAARAPAALLLDDLHWLDERSVALLHFAIRHLDGSQVSFLATVRLAELEENRAATRLLQGLRRDGALIELPVGPLSASAIAELTEPIAPDADAGRITEATAGNPLFALEMARALARGDEPLSSRVDALIGDRLARIGARAAALVPWIAAFGRGVPPPILAQLVSREASELFEPLGELERHGVVRADDDGRVDFVHDLVRSAAYRRLSTPRRTMLHRRIGVVLAAMADPDDSVATDAARHADLGGDSVTCAAACAGAARRCLRLLAYSDAEWLVALGRRHAERLPAAQRVSTELELIHVLLHPGVRLRDPGELDRDLAELCAAAQRLGLKSELSRGLSLLARAYHWGWGDIPRARALLQRATTLIEQAHEPDLEPLLEAARCLAYLEVDMDRTARLFDQLDGLHTLAEESFQYQWGLGLVQAWRGDVGSARAALGRAAALAAARSEHWVAFECTARLALLELEAGAVDAAGLLCGQLGPLAAKLGEGSEQPYAAAINALYRVGHDPEARGALDDAVSRLERIDARFLVPDILGIAAELNYRAGNLDLACQLAERATGVAENVSRPFESARGQALLARIAIERGDLKEARRRADAIDGTDGLPEHVKALRRDAVAVLQSEQGVDAWP